MLFTSFVGANTVNGPFSSNWSPISAILMSCISSEKRLSEANTSSNLPAGGVKTCSYRNRYVIIRNQRKVCLKKASGFHQQSRNCKPLGTHEFTPMFHAIRGAQSLVVCVLLCRSLFVLLSFSFWPLYCLFVDLQLLITALPWAS
jgi:hypothetical protein